MKDLRKTKLKGKNMDSINYEQLKRLHLSLYRKLKKDGWSENVLKRSEYTLNSTEIQISNLAWRKTYLIEEIGTT